jgi:hypothetical protein
LRARDSELAERARSGHGAECQRFCRETLALDRRLVACGIASVAILRLAVRRSRVLN